ncbi:MAG: hypothetical protein RLZZ488_2565 [Pseudomonadota bacterium]|jgi:hypothetical protein
MHVVRSLILVARTAGFVGLSTFALIACGQQQQGPVLAGERQSQSVRAESESLTARPLAAARSSDEGGNAQAAIKIEVFSKQIEPLTLQRGGNVKVSVPLSDSISATGRVRSIEFQSPSEALRTSVVAGRTLNLVVAEDAPEGHHSGRVVIRLDNGSVASQPVSVTVIP